jgi:hypothetical protein
VSDAELTDFENVTITGLLGPIPVALFSGLTERIVGVVVSEPVPVVKQELDELK